MQNPFMRRPTILLPPRTKMVMARLFGVPSITSMRSRVVPKLISFTLLAKPSLEAFSSCGKRSEDGHTLSWREVSGAHSWSPARSRIELLQSVPKAQGASDDRWASAPSASDGLAAAAGYSSDSAGSSGGRQQQSAPLPSLSAPGSAARCGRQLPAPAARAPRRRPTGPANSKGMVAKS